MRITFDTILINGKKQIFAAFHATDNMRDSSPRETRRATSTTGLLDPDAASETRAAQLLLREIDRLRDGAWKILHSQGLVGEDLRK